ncbi:hypothetical protein [Lentzea sp. CA-135723]|uniref:hypothetical protein n=1 Tax=Lentzea sp. CA-135723 TaxID=3239950 RepID=UPI003D9231F8
MRISLAWLEAECGTALDPAATALLLDEAGAEADVAGDRAIEVIAPPAFAHLVSVRGAGAEIKARLGLPSDIGNPAGFAAVHVVVGGPVRVPPREEEWLRDSEVTLSGTVTDVLAFVAIETGVRVAGHVEADGTLVLSAEGSGGHTAVARAAALLTAWSGAVVTKEVLPAAEAPRRITVTPERMRHLLGPGLDADTAVEALGRGGIRAVRRPDGVLVVTVPSGRSDLDGPEAVAAEVVRLRGGYRAVAASRLLPIRPPREDQQRKVRDLTRDAAVRFGLRQVVTPVLDRADGTGPIVVSGRTGLRHLQVRHSLVEPLVRLGTGHLFEIGAVPESAVPGDERFRFCAVLAGPVAEATLVDPAPRQAVFADLVALAELLARVHGRGEWDFVPAPHPGFDEEVSFSLVAGGTKLGRAGRLSEVDGYGLEVDLCALSALDRVRRTVRMPEDEPLSFNVTVVVPDRTPVADVRAVVAQAADAPLWRVAVKDLFRGGTGRLSLTLCVAFPGVPGEAVRSQRRRRREAVLPVIVEHGWEGR